MTSGRLIRIGFKPAARRHRVAAPASARVQRAAPAASRQLHAVSPRKVTHRRSLRFHARACRERKTDGAADFAPAIRCARNPLARSCAGNCFAPLARPGVNGAARSAKVSEVLRSLPRELARRGGGGSPHQSWQSLKGYQRLAARMNKKQKNIL